MTKKISKRLRAAAIEACEFCAACCDRGSGDSVSVSALYWGEQENAVLDLACAAWCAAEKISDSDMPWMTSYLEAAGLLRDGWSPGDPVEMKGGGS